MSNQTCATKRSTTRCANIPCKKVPYLFVVGKREAEERNVAIRQLGSDQQKVINLEVAIDDLTLATEPPY